MNCENERADLQTIEDLLERRKKIRDESISPLAYVSWNTKLIETSDPVFETIVVYLNFANNIVSFNKENDEVFHKIDNEVMRLSEQTPYSNYLILESRNSQGEVTRVCRIDDDRLIFQKVADAQNNKLQVFECFQFLAMVLKVAKKFCAHIGFYGDMSFGLNIENVQYHFLDFPQNRRLIDNYKSETRHIPISRIVNFDDFTDLSQTIQSMFREFCRFFHRALDSKIIEEIVEEYFIPFLK